MRYAAALAMGAVGIGGACAILHPGQPESMALSVFFNLLWVAAMDIVVKAGGK